MTDVITGKTDFIIAPAPVALPFIREERATALAVASDKPIELFPDVKTFGQQGYPGVVGDNVYGLVAPSGLPAPLVTLLHREISAIARTEAFAERSRPSQCTA